LREIRQLAAIFCGFPEMADLLPGSVFLLEFWLKFILKKSQPNLCRIKRPWVTATHERRVFIVPSWHAQEGFRLTLERGAIFL